MSVNHRDGFKVAVIVTAACIILAAIWPVFSRQTAMPQAATAADLAKHFEVVQSEPISPGLITQTVRHTRTGTCFVVVYTQKGMVREIGDVSIAEVDPAVCENPQPLPKVER